MEHSAWPAAIWLGLWMWKQQEQSALVAPIFVHIRQWLGMVARSGFHTAAGPTEVTAALRAASTCQMSHYFPFNLVFRSVTRCLSGSEGEKQVKQRLREGMRAPVLSFCQLKLPKFLWVPWTVLQTVEWPNGHFFSLLIKSQDEYTLPSLALIHSQI